MSRMYRIESGSTHGLADTAAFIDLLNNLPEQLQSFFSADREVIVTRAPGRLDLMGGIADYSGSLVLQLPISNGTHAALQRQEDNTIRIVSLAADPRDRPRMFEMPLAAFQSEGKIIEYDLACDRFNTAPDDHWAAYIAGAFLVLMRERGASFAEGARILIGSSVPEGKGVSSSASLEVSVMQAIAAAYEIEMSPREMAFLCQMVENLIAGAPCGVMDQMTAVCGEMDRLLALLCQPGELMGTVKLPDELSVWGIDSDIRHAVTGADYGTVRTAASMGYRMIAERAGLEANPTGKSGLLKIDDPKWRGYLANITPGEFEQSYAELLPHEMSGEKFLERYGGITDAVTSVKPGLSYPVFQATRHPIYEHARVKAFAEILKNWRSSNNEEQAGALGELMFESHDSYSACGLGSSGTDEIVKLVREAGFDNGLYGAKITGGGSGGTVAVLSHSDAEGAVKVVAEKYAQQTRHQPIVISGSSPGSSVFGYLRLFKEIQR
ncbi:MAG: GHMP kinase [Acidobacteria bacterium]|nr:GHMP kinase [Acidobacteriota bacterium]